MTGEQFMGLVAEYGGRFLLVTVNTDRQKALARSYGVRSLPLAKLFRDGEVVETFHGMPVEADLRKALDRNLVTELDVLRSRGLGQFRDGDVEGALQTLANAALADPEDLRIPTDIARILLREGRIADAERLLSSLPEGAQADEAIAILRVHSGFLSAAADVRASEQLEARVSAQADDLEARYRLGAARLVADDYAAAMAQLYEILCRDRSFRDDIGRRGLLAIFAILGDGHPLVSRYRALLTNAIH
jgi:putative thioredoxin